MPANILHPMAPRAAVAYFARLVPKLGKNPERFGTLMERKAFTLAVATEQKLLDKIKAAITERLETGHGVSTATADIQDLLDAAGVSPKNPQYAEMTFRTNMQDAYNQGSDEERRDPEVVEDFPAWQFSGIDDGRERHRHRIHFGQYFPASVSFAEVRDSAAGKFDGFNCRCTCIPLYKSRWKELQAQGARFADGWEHRATMFAEDANGMEHKGKGEGGGQFTKGNRGGSGSSEKKTDKQTAKSKARIPEEKPSTKVARAKAAHHMVDKTIQRYAEEHNESRFAKRVKGVSLPDSEPVDVIVGADKGRATGGVELKTMVSNKAGKLTMDRYSQARKIEWERVNKAPFHTVVLDDSAVFQAKGSVGALHPSHGSYAGKHDETKRRIFYRRGVAGSARIASMHECKDMAELKRLMTMPESRLPAAAQRTDAEMRVGRWKFFADEKGKGYRNTKTGVEVRAKK